MQTTKRSVRLTPLRWLLYCVLCLHACSFSGCPEFDILVAMGCPDCPQTSEDRAVITNGVEEILQGTGGESEESPGLPGSMGESDRVPSAGGVLAALEWLCASGFDIVGLLGGAPIHEESAVSQGLPEIRSFGFAVSPLLSARSRLVGADRPDPLIYMSNHAANNVAVIDTGNPSLLSAIPVGGRPRGLTISPDGAQVFVASETTSRISVIDTETQAVSATIDLPSGARPYGVAITPDGSMLWVVDFAQRGRVYVIDVASETMIDSIGVGPFPVQVAISPDGSLAYVANSGSNNVTVIDIRTRTRNRSVGVESPYAVAFHPTGNRVYVTSRTVPGQVFAIDTATDMVLDRWDVGEKPEFLAVGSDGLRLYVTSRLSNFMNVINLLSGQNEAIPDVGFGLGPIALLPPRPSAR